MIGAFVINDETDVCFVQYGEHESIAAMRITRPNLCVATLADGTEEMFTTELNHQIITALRSKIDILVAHLNDDGNVLDEYNVPLSFAP